MHDSGYSKWAYYPWNYDAGFVRPVEDRSSASSSMPPVGADTGWSGAGQFLRRFNAVKNAAEPEDARFDDAHALQTVIATFTNLAQ